MSRKIPIHELSAALARTCSISQETAETFIRSFFDLVAEGVIAGEIVRVKGLGSFTATGDTSDPVHFEPDKALAAAINAPFDIFEPEPLSETVSDEVLASVKVEIEENPEEPVVDSPVEIPSQKPDEEQIPAVEIITPIPTPEEETAEPVVEETIELPSISTPTEETVAVPKEEAFVETTTQTEDTPQIPVAEESSVESETQVIEIPDQIPEPVVTTSPVQASVPEPDPQPGSPVTSPTAEESEILPPPVPVQPVVPKVTPPVFPPEEDPEELVGEEDGEPTNGSGLGFGWGLVIGLLTGLALGACGVYFGINYLFPMPSMQQIEQKMEEQETELRNEIENIETIDSAAAVAALSSTDTVVAPEANVVPTPDSVASRPAAAVQDSPVVPTVIKDQIRSGYLLHEMARKHYGSKAFWVYIYEENKSKIGNPNHVKAGLELIIPAPEKYGINPDDPASIKAANELAGKILSKYPN